MIGRRGGLVVCVALIEDCNLGVSAHVADNQEPQAPEEVLELCRARRIGGDFTMLV